MRDEVRRRHFLQLAAAAGATWSVTAHTAAPGQPPEKSSPPSGRLSTESRVDVLVVGGGTAGTIAAVQAARAGANTLLVERGSLLGGTTTVGGVCFPGLFHAWGKQIIAGIGWELVCKSVEMDGGSLPDFSVPPARHWHHQIIVNPFLYAILAEEACREAGVSICYYESPSTIRATKTGWQVEVTGPGTRRQVLCKQLIDCTGGADTAGLAGLPRLREDETQPGSMLFKFGVPFHAGREQLSAVDIHGADSSNSVTKTAANLAGRGEILKRLREKLARGDKDAHLTQLQHEAAFRESYRIVGETQITHEDYTSGRSYPDAVCYAFYPVDLHTRHGVTPKPLRDGILPSIPLRALIPKGSRNLMVAGRSVSSDRLANSGLRVQASCMAMGQAAGAAAALAAQGSITPLDISFTDLVELLKQHGAIVPPGHRS